MKLRSEVEALEAEIAAAETHPTNREALMELSGQVQTVLWQIEAIRASHRERRASIVAAAAETQPKETWTRLSTGRLINLDPPDDSGLGAFEIEDDSHKFLPRRVIDVGPDKVASDAPPEPRLKKREYVVRALDLLGCPSAPAAVSAVIKRLYDVEVAASQFASFRKGDERAYDRGKKEKVMIVPALNGFDLSARLRTVALSTWPLERRIMGSLSDRANALQAILTAHAYWTESHVPAWRDLTVTFARDFRFAPPDADGTDEELAAIVSLARESLDEIRDQDLAERDEAMERAVGLLEQENNAGLVAMASGRGQVPSMKWQLFGRPIALDIIRGGRDE